MKLKVTCGRFAVLFILTVFIFAQLPAPPITAAATAAWQDAVTSVPSDLKAIASFSHTKYIQFWHYSGGYWRATVEGSTVQFSDAQVKGDFSNLSALIGNTVELQFDLPPEVAAVISAKKIVMVAAYGRDNLFDGTPQYRIEGGNRGWSGI